jgi:hypothetical protein
MANELIAPLMGLAGVIVGGALGILNSHFAVLRQERQKRHDERLKHLEEIFECLERTETDFFSFYTFQFYSMLQGKIDAPKQATEFPLGRLELLIKLYCPTLTPSFATLIALRDKCANCYTSALMSVATKDIQKMTAQLQPIIPLLKEITAHCATMKTEVVSLAVKRT